MNKHKTITTLAGTLPRRKIAPIVGMTPNNLSKYCWLRGISLKLKFEALSDDYKPQKAKSLRNVR
jgi:hypothetical protein